MKNFGRTMKKKINEYEVGKGLVAEYVASMDNLCDDYKRLIELYDSCIYPEDNPELADFNYDIAVKFIRTWDVIKNDIQPHNKNLIFAIEASGQNYAKCLEYFNGVGNGYKNKATLHVLVCNARKEVEKKYMEKYGRDNL